jgi:hypothetical protein
MRLATIAIMLMASPCRPGRASGPDRTVLYACDASLHSGPLRRKGAEKLVIQRRGALSITRVRPTWSALEVKGCPLATLAPVQVTSSRVTVQARPHAFAVRIVQESSVSATTV